MHTICTQFGVVHAIFAAQRVVLHRGGIIVNTNLIGILRVHLENRSSDTEEVEAHPSSYFVDINLCQKVETLISELFPASLDRRNRFE